MRQFLIPMVAATAVIASPAVADIQPKSGLWAGTVEFADSKGCPKELVDALHQRKEGYEKQIDFPAPFDPAVLDGNDANFKWKRVGENSWKATFSQSTKTPMGDVSATSVSNLTVLSETEMVQDAVVTIKLPAQVALMAGIKGDCTVASNVTHSFKAP